MANYGGGNSFGSMLTTLGGMGGANTLFNGYGGGIMNPSAAGVQGGPIRYVNDLSESDTLNKVIWVYNELYKMVYHTNMTMDDVSKEIHFLVDSGVIREKARYMLKSPFGFVANHMRTDEPLENGKFKFVFNYMIDRTKAATATFADQPCPQAAYEQLTRMVTCGVPLAISIGLEKQLYDTAMKAFGAILGGSIHNPQVKQALGLSVNKVELPHVKMPLFQIMLFMQHLEFQQISCAQALMRGDHVEMLRYIQRRSPSINALIKYDRFKDAMSAVHWAKHQNEYIPQYLFGLNKRMHNFHKELDTVGSYFQTIYQIFTLNTDNATAQIELQPYLESAPFINPAAILIITNSTRQALINIGALSVNYNTEMLQTISVLSLTDDDMNPMQTLIPRQGVRLVNHQFRYDPNNGDIMHDRVKTRFNMEYFQINMNPIMVVTVTESDFAASVRNNIDMTRQTNFDFIMPTGCQLVNNRNTSEASNGLYPMTTSFPNEHGNQYDLHLYDMAPWFCQHVVPVLKYNPRRDHSLYTTCASAGRRPTGFSRNEEEIGKTFLFYHVKRMSGENEGGLNPEGESASSTSGAAADVVVTPSTTDEDTDEEYRPSPKRFKRDVIPPVIPTVPSIIRNKYVVQNYYMDKALIVSNTLNVYHAWQTLPMKFKVAVFNRFRKPNVVMMPTNPEIDSTRRAGQVGPDPPVVMGQDSVPSDRSADEVVAAWHHQYIEPMEHYGDHVSRRIVADPHGFFESVAAAVIKFNRDKTAYGLNKTNTFQMIYEMAQFVCYIENGDFEAFYNTGDTSQNFNLMKYINPGFGVLWLKPEFVESDSMIMCRPAGFGNISGMPELSKVGDQNNMKQTVQYQTSMITAKFTQSLKHPAIVIPNAFMVGWTSTTTDIIVDPSNLEQAQRALARLESLRSKSNLVGTVEPDLVDGWWPVICPPRMRAEFFESSNSPTGRFFTHWTTEKDFQRNFDNTNIKDVKEPRVFTQNSVFENMFFNINTYMVYNRLILDNKNCPLTRYMKFNNVAANSIKQMIDHQNRLFDVKNKTNLQTYEEKPGLPMIESEPLEQRTNPAAGGPIQENDITLLIGSAIPKLCFSNTTLFKPDFRLAESYQLNKVIISPKTGDFYVTGTDALEKFDRKGIGHSTFTF